LDVGSTLRWSGEMPRPAQRLADATDLSDDAWQLLNPLRPPEPSGGRPRTDPSRDVLTGRQEILRGGGAWR
jgi:transposase